MPNNRCIIAKVNYKFLGFCRKKECNQYNRKKPHLPCIVDEVEQIACFALHFALSFPTLRL